MSSRRVSELSQRERRSIRVLPTTRLGKWGVGLGVASTLAMLGWRLMGPLGGFPSLALAIAAGSVALVAIGRRGERAILAFVAVLPLVSAVLFLLAELLVGHD